MQPTSKKQLGVSNSGKHRQQHCLHAGVRKASKHRRHDQATARHSKVGQAEASQVRPAQAGGAARLEQRLRAGVRGGEAHVQRGRALQRVEVPAARAQRIAQRVRVQAARAGRGVGRHEAHHRHGGLAGQAQLGDGAHALRKVGRDLRRQG